jgi:hypothetical protein
MKGESSISELIADIEHKRLILPEFQRGYVWTSKAVREFLDSLYRGYPTGSFLVWRTPDPGRIRGDSDIGRGDNKFFQLILDGQQRLTSIYTVMKGEPPPFYEEEHLFFNLHFNLLDETFAYYKKTAMKGRDEWIPVTEFFQRGLADFFSDRTEGHPETQALYMDNFGKFQKLDAIRSYMYFMNSVSETNIERVVEIFNLVNSKGTKLSKSDLALAHICSSWPEARQTLRDAQLRYEQYHFRFELDILVRFTSTVATGSGLYEPLYKTTIEDIKEAWKKVTHSLDYLLNFLRSDAYIDSDQHLKSPYPLVPLVARLCRNDGLFTDRREKRDFLHWMFAALMWGRYSGTTDTKLNADIAALNQDEPAVALRANIVKERGRIDVQGHDLDRAGARSTFYPMTYIVARARGAVDWFDGNPLYSKNVGALFGLEAHHIFPTSVLYKHGYKTDDTNHRQIVNQIANLAFLTKQANIKISNDEPLGYLEDVEARYPGALAAQFVPLDRNLWSIDHFEEFLAERRRLIADAINRFMGDLLADDGAPTDTAIEDLIRAGESATLEFKSSLRWDYRQQAVNKALTKVVTKTLVAFLNHDGGTLLVGVADDGRILGLKPDFSTLTKADRDGWELALRNALREQLGPEINPLVEVTFTETAGESVASLSCQAHHKPVFLTDGNQAEFWVRAGASSQPLDVRATAEYIAKHWSAAAMG